MNYHFYLNKRRLISFIVDKSDHEKPAKDGQSLESRFFAVWDENDKVEEFGGLCLISTKSVECASSNLVYMSSIWAN